jgi:hypothetical protein
LDERSVQEQASGWVDITLAPQPGAFDRQRHPQAGSIVVLTSQRPPPRQALDWLLAADRAPNGSRGPSPTPASRGPTPEPASAQDPAAKRSGGSRSPSPHPAGAAFQEQSGAAAEEGARQQRRQGRGDEKSEAAALAAQSGRAARRMRYAPPDLDGGAADAAAAAAGEANIESGEMMHQIADCLAEDGEISEAAAEAASLAAEAATCSLVGGVRGGAASGSSSAAAVWLGAQDIMEEGQCGAAQPDARQEKQQQQPQQGGGRPPTGKDSGGGVPGAPAPRLVIAGVLRVAPRRDSGGSWVVSAHPRCSAHAAEDPNAPCAKVASALCPTQVAFLRIPAALVFVWEGGAR